MLTWIALTALLLFSLATYMAGRRRAVAVTAGKPAQLHSLPGYYGSYAALWAGVPAALLILLFAMFGGRLEAGLLRVDPPAAVQQLTAPQQDVFFDDARAIAHGGTPSETIYDGALKTALEDKAAKSQQLTGLIQYGSIGLGAILALAGAFIAYPRISPQFRARNKVEGWVAGLFIVCSVTAILTTAGIIASLVWESWRFFQAVPIHEFLFGMEWNPQIAMRADQYAGTGALGRSRSSSALS